MKSSPNSARKVVPFLVSATGGLILAAFVLVRMGLPGAAAEETERLWYRSPTLAVMTGYIMDSRKPYSIQEWEKNLGNKMDADRWVADFRELGATYLIFYAKWCDGYCFFDTKTTGYKAHRDFCREIAQACQRGNLKLVWYFNPILDANPEFSEWFLHYRNGKPIMGSGDFPVFRFQTLHSPFRAKCLEQVRELLGNYGCIDGMWLDIFTEWGKNNTSSPWRVSSMKRGPSAQSSRRIVCGPRTARPLR